MGEAWSNESLRFDIRIVRGCRTRVCPAFRNREGGSQSDLRVGEWQVKLPVIVWIFAGACRSENREKQVGTTSWLTARGYAVAAHTRVPKGIALIRFPLQFVLLLLGT